MDVKKFITGAACVSVWLLLGSQSIHASPAVETLGYFSNQQTYLVTDDPHMEGYSLTLYRQGKIVFGRFCQATGIEVPCAPIQHALIDNRRTLKFQVKLSIGTEISKETGPQGRPAYRLIEFDGKIKGKLITGVISTKSAYAPLAPAETECVKLPRVTYKVSPIRSYQKWAADPLNKPVDF